MGGPAGAFPRPRAQPFPALRARPGATGRTGLCGVGFIDNFHPTAGAFAFVLQLGFELTPARIEDGLAVPCCSLPGCAHVADEYRPVVIDQGGGEFVQGVLALIPDFGANRRYGW